MLGKPEKIMEIMDLKRRKRIPPHAGKRLLDDLNCFLEALGALGALGTLEALGTSEAFGDARSLACAG